MSNMALQRFTDAVRSRRMDPDKTMLVVGGQIRRSDRDDARISRPWSCHRGRPGSAVVGPADWCVVLGATPNRARTGVPVQLHHGGVQATAASTRSSLVSELSLSHSLMAPANPCARNWAMMWWLAAGRSGWAHRAMNHVA